MNQPLLPRLKLCPAFRGQIIGLRIFIWLGQGVIAVMHQMGITIQSIGIPHRQRQGAKQLIEPGDARRVAVDQLMHQRQEITQANQPPYTPTISAQVGSSLRHNQLRLR